MFAKTGFNPNLGTVLVGIVHWVACCSSSFFLARFGRRNLLWIFSIPMIVSMAIFGML